MEKIKICTCDGCLIGSLLCSILLLLFSAILSGCGASYFSASTTASYEQGKLYYTSTKNQENFHANAGFDDQGNLKSLDVTTTATTAESAIAAAMQSLSKLIDVLTEQLKAASAAAMAGS